MCLLYLLWTSLFTLLLWRLLMNTHFRWCTYCVMFYGGFYGGFRTTQFVVIPYSNSFCFVCVWSQYECTSGSVNVHCVMLYCSGKLERHGSPKYLCSSPSVLCWMSSSHCVYSLWVRQTWSARCVFILSAKSWGFGFGGCLFWLVLSCLDNGSLCSEG